MTPVRPFAFMVAGLPIAVAANSLRGEWPGMGQPVSHLRQDYGMEVASLILGIIGTIAGVGALAWQVITWRRSGPVVTVEVNQGLPTYDDCVGNPITCVTATNSGRAPVTVTSWGLRLPNGQTMFVQQPFPGSDTLPYRLEQGASGTWSMETVQVAETSRAQGVDYEELRGFVKLGNGKTVYARRKGIRLAPGFPWPQDAKR
jgi:hypothetical protein